VTIYAGASGGIQGAGVKTLDGATIDNQSANLTWDGQGSIMMQHAATFYVADGAAASFSLNGAGIGAAIFGSSIENVIVQSGGTFNENNNGGNLTIRPKLTNFGNVNVRAGQLFTSVTINSGTMTVFNGQILNLGVNASGVRLDGTAPGASGSTITGTGKTIFWLGSNIYVFGTGTLSCSTVDDQSTTIDGPGILQINSTT
jgi:hypothetical protein